MSYRMCVRCIMDTSDPDIRFDGQGVCGYCRLMDRKAERYVLPEAEREERLAALVREIREEGKTRPYDCVIGVSGGIDSTYVAFLVKQAGLRPLAVHLDNGWDTEISVNNIHNALEILNIDLKTVVLDWEEFRDLQLAFLRASTPDGEIPTDHAIYAVLRKTAAEQGVRTIIDGVNYSSETIMPPSWSQGYSDWGYIRLLHRKYGTVPLRTYPHYTFWNLFYYKRILRQRTVSILNYVDYNKFKARMLLLERMGWKDYGDKHHESLYTRFFQAYILPVKFGFDKRRAHLSTLINAGQIGRDEALREMEKDPVPADWIDPHRKYVAKKLGLSEAELDRILALPPRRYVDFRPARTIPVERLEERIFHTYNPFRILSRRWRRRRKSGTSVSSGKPG
jgi:N-acetyl sugar amidotransferase